MQMQIENFYEIRSFLKSLPKWTGALRQLGQKISKNNNKM